MVVVVSFYCAVITKSMDSAHSFFPPRVTFCLVGEVPWLILLPLDSILRLKDCTFVGWFANAGLLPVTAISELEPVPS
jgi:hypothetical protein